MVRKDSKCGANIVLGKEAMGCDSGVIDITGNPK